MVLQATGKPNSVLTQAQSGLAGRTCSTINQFAAALLTALTQTSEQTKCQQAVNTLVVAHRSIVL